MKTWTLGQPMIYQQPSLSHVISVNVIWSEIQHPSEGWKHLANQYYLSHYRLLLLATKRLFSLFTWVGNKYGGSSIIRIINVNVECNLNSSDLCKIFILFIILPVNTPSYFQIPLKTKCLSLEDVRILRWYYI